MKELPDPNEHQVNRPGPIESRLIALGITLPATAKPQGAYVPAVRSGCMLFTSGQLPIVDGELKWRGIVGKDVPIDEAYQAARVCALNALAVLQSEIGHLDKVKRVVKVTGFVASAESFIAQPQVVNGASELLLEVFGEQGKHARSAIGVAALPLNSPVEVEMVVEVEPMPVT